MTTPPPQPSHADQRFFDRLKVTGRSTWLLLALIVLMILYPFADSSSLAWRLLLGGLNTAILVAGALAAGGSRRTLLVAVAFALPALVLQWMVVVRHDREDVSLIYLVTLVLFYGFTIVHLLAFVLRPGPVTGNKLHAAMSAYIMTGLLWAFLYTLVNAVAPGAFAFQGESDLRHPLDWRQFVFFSFTTMTTTGYGDTIPIAGHAQSLAVLEQLAGTFYVAILIARLAGLYQPGGRSQHG